MDYKIFKKRIIPIIVLICVLSIGTAYAGTTGLLDFNSTATINPNAKVIFNKMTYQFGDTGYSSVISADGQSLFFTIPLDPVNNHARFSVDVQNSGNVPVLLGNLTPTVNPVDGIRVSWPTEFNGLRLEPGEYSAEYNIDVQLTNDSIPPGSYTFSASLSYEQIG
jgi:hypothetical protein